MPRRSSVEDDDDENWSESAEQQLLTWAEKAAGLRWLHVEAGRLEKYLNDAVSVPVVILSTLAGLGSIVSNNCSGWVSVAFTVINLLNASLVSLQRYLSPGEKASTHNAIAADYSKLYRRIAQELSLPIRRREKCIDFTTACRTEYDRLVSSSLDVPSCVVRRFKKRFASTEQAQPEVVSGGLEQIPQRQRRPTAIPEVAQGPIDAAALGQAVRTGPGMPPAGSRKMRRASTVINDVLQNPAITPQVYRSTRLPDISSHSDLAIDLEAMPEARTEGDEPAD